MQINLIHRKNIVHAGIIVRNNGERFLISSCNSRWYDRDITEIGDSERVTCKRCLKLVKEAEQNDGYIDFKKRCKNE